MIALLLIFCVTVPAILALGLALVRLVDWPDWLQDPQDRFVAASWTGLLALASGLLAVASVAPVKPWMLSVSFAPLLSPAIREESRQLLAHRANTLILLILAPAVAFFQSGPERNFDASLYHNQLVRWIADHGIVPGLSLIHYRLSFSSSLFSAGALFDQAPWESRLSRYVTGIILILLLAQFSAALARASCRNALPRDWYTLLGAPILVAFAHWQAMTVSTSPNWGAAAAVFTGGWLLIEGASPLALLIAGGAFAVKLTVAPLGLAALSRFRLRVFVLAACLGVPLLIANYRASGCPLFPAPLFCAQTAQGGGAELAALVEMETRNYTRNAGRDLEAPLTDLSWLGRWARRPYTMMFMPAALVALLAHLYFRRWTRAATLGVLGTAYFTFLAPDYRYGFGYIVALYGSAAAISVKPWLWFPRLSHAAWLGTVAATLVAVGLAGDQLGYVQRGDPRLAFDPRRFAVPVAGFRHQVPPVKLLVNDIEFWRPPVDDRCGTLPVPCTPYAPNPTLHLCDPARGWRGGFCRKVE